MNNFREYGFEADFEGEILAVKDDKYFGISKISESEGWVANGWENDGVCLYDDVSHLKPIKKEYGKGIKMTKNEVINRIKEISKEQISRGHNKFSIYQESKINVNEYFEISNLIYSYIDDKEKPKFLSLRDILLVDGQMGYYNEDVNLVIKETSNRIDEMLK